MSFRHELIIAVGDPIDENPTGVMMDAAFNHLKLHWRYQLINAPRNSLSNIVSAIKNMDIKGANFTIPHKEDIVEYLDILAPSAKIIGAVNTITRENDVFTGHNTDGQGFLKALQANNINNVAGKKIAILGAGGAARAIAVELALAGAAEINFYNRTIERIEKLINDIQSHLTAKLTAMPWLPQTNISILQNIDILVNATSIGLYPNPNMPPVDFGSLRKSTLIVDVIPNPPETKFLTQAKSQGFTTINGLEMLVQQGAIAFELWTGEKAPVEIMRKALTQAFVTDTKKPVKIKISTQPDMVRTETSF